MKQIEWPEHDEDVDEVASGRFRRRESSNHCPFPEPTKVPVSIVGLKNHFKIQLFLRVGLGKANKHAEESRNYSNYDGQNQQKWTSNLFFTLLLYFKTKILKFRYRYW